MHSLALCCERGRSLAVNLLEAIPTLLPSEAGWEVKGVVFAIQQSNELVRMGWEGRIHADGAIRALDTSTRTRS